MPARRKKANPEVEDSTSPSAPLGTRRSARQKDASAIPENSSDAVTRKRKAVLDTQEEKKTRKRSKETRPSAATEKNSDDGAEEGSAPTKKRASGKSREQEGVKTPEEIFDTYADANDPQAMGAEGLERLCNDANIPMDGARPLLLSWQLDAKELGTFSRDEWINGMNELQIRSLDSLADALIDLEELIVLRKPPPAKPTERSISKGIKSKSAPPAIDKYKKDRYWKYAATVDSAFSEFYGFCFTLVKKEGARSIDMDYACAFWSVILAPTYPLMSEVIDFINDRGTYKGVNKDLWTMMKEYCESVTPNLDGYDSEGAWPTLLDDFVEWKKGKAGSSAGSDPENARPPST